MLKTMFYSFRFRLWFGATFINGSLILAIIYFSYVQNKNILIAGMASRLLDTGRTAVLSFTEEEKSSLLNLTEKLEDYRLDDAAIQQMKPGEYIPSVPDDRLESLYADKGFQKLVRRLRTVKLQVLRVERNENLFYAQDPVIHYSEKIYSEKEQKSAIRYIYIAVPYKGRSDLVRYVVDADYGASGDETGNPPGNIYKTKQNSFLHALKGIPSSENEFISDSWGVWLTAAVPVMRNGEVIGMLGLDYDATGESNRIHDLLYTSLILGGAFLPFSLFLTYLLAKWLASPIRVISDAAGRVRKRDFSVEISLNQKDEIGKLGETFNQMVKSIRTYSQELEDLNSAYYKFVPKEFLDQLGVDSIKNISLGHEVKKDMTVLFSDIRSFTTISESMPPEENFKFLNSYLNTAAPVIRTNGGFIDKYIGDAIMALFPDDPSCAIQTGIDILKTLEGYNSETAKKGWPPVRIGVGIHTGSLMMGTIGEDMRLQTTVIADAVNLASRLESLTKKLGVHIIVSRSALERAESAGASFRTRFLGSVRVKGKTKGVEIHEVLDCFGDDLIEIRMNTKKEFERAVQLLHTGKLGEAEDLFLNVIAADESDNAARYMLKRCRI